MRPGQGDINALTQLIDFVLWKGSLKSLSMIEVGSYAGQSMEIFVNTGKVKSIVCIDPWQGDWDPNDPASGTNMALVESLFDQRREALKDKASILKYKGVLEQFVQDVQGKEILSNGVDLIYIDALHTYEGCKNDLLLSKQFVKPRVAYSGHDYNVNAWQGVVNAVNEVVGHPDCVYSETSWCKLV